MYGNLNNNIITSTSSTSSSSPTPLPAPYSEYWTRYKNPCPNYKKTPFFQLNMKRKALTLQHNNTQLKQTNQYIKAVKNQNHIANRDASGLIPTSKCRQDKLLH